LKRFPDATTEELKEAHGYAYGGAIIQDMGYYPHGSFFFSDLTHYVRSGDFVLALLHDSKDLDGYAFALGALAHHVSDNEGHPIGTNRAVPLLYAAGDPGEVRQTECLSKTLNKRINLWTKWPQRVPGSPAPNSILAKKRAKVKWRNACF
jgi:hypothetical protein